MKIKLILTTVMLLMPTYLLTLSRELQYYATGVKGNGFYTDYCEILDSPGYLFLPENKESYPELNKFLKMYAPSPEQRKLIEKHKEKIAKNNWDIEELPNFCIDRAENIANRLINAVCLGSFIKQKNLTCLAVPEQFIYEIDGKFFLFAKKIRSRKSARSSGSSKITPKEMQQIEILKKETGYSDFAPGNLIRNIDDDKITFIDTEDDSFSHDFSDDIWYNQKNFEAIIDLKKARQELYEWKQIKRYAVGLKFFIYDRKKDSDKLQNIKEKLVKRMHKYKTLENFFVSLS